MHNDNLVNTDNKVISNAIKYSDNIRAYREYIKRVAYLVKVLGLPDNAISQSIVLGRLTRGGLFSKNGTFAYNNGTNGEIEGFYGLNVIKGMGNSKHMASFQSNVLEKNNLPDNVLFCDLATPTREHGTTAIPNYAVNLIEFRDTLYGYDTRRNLLLAFGHDGNLRPLYSEGSQNLEYTPITDIKVDDYAFEKRIPLLEMLDMFKGDKVITPGEYKYICEDIKRNIQRNAKYDLFKDFGKNSEKYVKEITRGIK